MRTLAFLALAATLAAAAAQAAPPRMSLSQAIDLCTERARLQGRQLYGRFGDEPPPNLINERYRACVWANSHQYPPGPPKYRDSVLTLFKGNS